MIINNLDLISVTFAPLKTNPPLLVNTDTILISPIPRQFFQVVRGLGYVNLATLQPHLGFPVSLGQYVGFLAATCAKSNAEKPFQFLCRQNF